MLCPESLLGSRLAIRRQSQPNDSVNVVWHDHVRTQFDADKMRRNLAPAGIDDSADSIQLHDVVDNFAEKSPFVRGTNRQEVRLRSRIIEKTAGELNGDAEEGALRA